MQTPFKFIFFSVLFLLVACQHKIIISKVEESHLIINSPKIDSSIYKTISPYKKVYDEQMTTVIAQSEGAFLKADVESTLGNFFCDAVIYETKKILGKDSAMANVAVFNKGGLRNSLPKGNITVGNIFELMPFDNELVLLKLSGEQVKDMLAKIAQKGGIPVSGIRMKIQFDKPVEIFINRKELDESKDYWIITSDYLANGGDNYTFFKNAKERKTTNVLLRNVIINYCKDITQQGKTLKPLLDGRIQLSK